MSRTRHPRARRSAPVVASLLSVLALLAMACYPLLAQAQEATGPVYETEVPTVPSEQSPGGGGHPGGSNGGSHAGISNSPKGNGNGSGAGGGSHSGQGNQGQGAERGQPGSGQRTAEGSVGEAKPVTLGPGTANASEDDSSSSPLVPILIAIVVLAAISIGAYYYRQRRQGAGSSVSPKAS
ncbi:MAG: hypothetical protein ACJ76D_06490 [Solirubrobacterales bacterium]